MNVDKEVQDSFNTSVVSMNDTFCVPLESSPPLESSAPLEFSASLESSNTINLTSASTISSPLDPVLLKIEELKQQLKKAENELEISHKVINKLTNSNKVLLARNRKRCKKKRLRVEEGILKSRNILHKVFNNDQIEWLQHDSKKRRLYKWSNETIKKALRLKLACTENGYKELINQNIPLPSRRTLRRSLEGINFSPGICEDIFEALKDKVEYFTDNRERDCMLGIDEISLVEGERIDPLTNSTTGFITIPNSQGKNSL